MDWRIAALLTGNLVTTMGMLMLTGMANELADDLALPVTSLGHILAVAPLVLAFGAPLLAMTTSRAGRRSLLAGAMLIAAASHLLAAASGSVAVLIVARALTGISTGLFTPQAAATAMLLADPSRRARVVSLVFIGFAVAHTIGLPIATWLSGVIGWRATAALVGLLSLASAAWLWLIIPRDLSKAPLDRGAWGELARNPVMLATITVTGLQVAAQFVLYSYIAPSARDTLGASPAVIAWLFAALGIGGILGNGVASRIADRTGPVIMATVSMLLMVAAMLVWGLAQGSVAMALLSMWIWGLGSFSAASSQQVRLIGLNAKLGTVSLAMNTSCTYAGSALGTVIGSALLASLGYGSLAWGAIAVFALALSIHWASVRWGKRL